MLVVHRLPAAEVGVCHGISDYWRIFESIEFLVNDAVAATAKLF
jgi:hypothetical protein